MTTTRETADHAELAAMKPDDILAVLRADRLPECSFDDGRTWELDGVGVAETFTRAADTIDALLSEIAALRVRAEEADALASKHFVALREKQDDAAILKHGKLEAERQRDELRKALEPFSDEFGAGIPRPDDFQIVGNLNLGLFRRATEALANQGADQ